MNSSLCGVLLLPKSHKCKRLHSGTSNDCIAPITYAIIKSTKEEPPACSWR